jgi:hypothetical protein
MRRIAHSGDITPNREYREACRRVLGDDDPQTVLNAIRHQPLLIAKVRRVHREIIKAKVAQKRNDHPKEKHR